MAGGIFPPAFSALESIVGNFRKPFPLGNRSAGTSESHFRLGIDRRKPPKAISAQESIVGNFRKPFPLGNRAAGTPESHFRLGIEQRKLPKAISDCVASFHRHAPVLFLFANLFCHGADGHDVRTSITSYIVTQRLHDTVVDTTIPYLSSRGWTC